MTACNCNSVSSIAKCVSLLPPVPVLPMKCKNSIADIVLVETCAFRSVNSLSKRSKMQHLRANVNEKLCYHRGEDNVMPL